MAQILTDSFTDTPGLALESHVGQLGATWTKHTAGTGVNEISSAGRCWCQALGNGTALHYASAAPASADYTVQADEVWLSAPGNTESGIALRCDTAAHTLYLLRYSGFASQWQIYKGVAGVYTLLGSWGATINNGDTHTLKLAATGTAITATIDGTDRITVTDAAISATGKPAIRSDRAVTDTTGAHLDNMTCTDTSAAAITAGAGWTTVRRRRLLLRDLLYTRSRIRGR